MPGVDSRTVSRGGFSIPPEARWRQEIVTYGFARGFPAALKAIVRREARGLVQVCALPLIEQRGGKPDILWREGDPGEGNEGYCRIGADDKPVITLRPTMIERRGERRAGQIVRHEKGHAAGLPHCPREGMTSIMYHQVPENMDSWGSDDVKVLAAVYGSPRSA